MDTDVICEVCGRTDHFEGASPLDLVAAIHDAGWRVDLEHRLCPDHAAPAEAEQPSAPSEPGDPDHPADAPAAAPDSAQA